MSPKKPAIREPRSAISEPRSAIREPSAEYILIQRSGLFDRDWYLERYPDVANDGIDPLRHYVEHGVLEGRQPNLFFEPVWYRDVYLPRQPDVVPFTHYLTVGAHENFRPGPKFDPKWYIRQFGHELSDKGPLEHYLRIGRSLGHLPFDPSEQYAKIEVINRQNEVVLRDAAARHIAKMFYRPRFAVFIEGDDGSAQEDTLKSLKRQIFTDFTILETKDQFGRTAEIEDTYFLWLRAGDHLSSFALYEFATVINADPKSELIYSDEDYFDGSKFSKPFFKPDWSPDTLEAFNYIGHAACFKASASAQHIAASTSYFDFLLRLTETNKDIRHIEKILLHSHTTPLAPLSERAIESQRVAIAGRLTRTHRQGTISHDDGHYHISLERPSEPLISVVIPTAGKVIEIGGREIDLLMNVVSKMRTESTYKNLEFIIVDNDDLGVARLATLRDWGCKATSYREPIFNVAKKLNLGATMATGEFLLLMNDDIEHLVPDWIERMLDHLYKPHVGVVGSKLLYPNGTIQHAGVVTNFSSPDHVRRGYPRDDRGYFYSTSATRNYQAVTGACMMTRTETYRSVGGYTEELAISYNDVDFCLKLVEKGLSVVYAPEAQLTHFESQSRVPWLDPKEAEYFSRRWAKAVTKDPYYNEMELSLAPPTFELHHRSRVL